MPSLYGREIPETLCNKIIDASLVETGIYDGKHHRFLSKGFQPTASTKKFVASELPVYGFDPEDADRAILDVLDSVNSDTNELHTPSISLEGANQLPPLSLLKFSEENNSETELLYIGDSRFYVLATTRSTLLPGNVILARTKPLNVGSSWEFDLFESLQSKVALVPEGYKKYKAWFKTTNVLGITLYLSPSFYDVIDNHEAFGGKLDTTTQYSPSFVLSELLYNIHEVVDSLKDTVLPDNTKFPQYDQLISSSKQRGVKTFLLNHLIEVIERREKFSYVFNESDWYVYKTKEQLEEEKRLADQANKKKYKTLCNELDEELKTIKRRNVFFFFQAPGVLSPESQNHIRSIRVQLEDLAKIGYGTEGMADSKLADAQRQSLPERGHNLKVGGIILGIVAVSVFALVSFFTAKNSMAVYDGKMVEVANLLDDDQFNEAKELVIGAKDDFNPGYLRFIVSGPTKKTLKDIENRIDLFVEERIGQVETMIRASRGKITEEVWEFIKEAMELRPDNETLNQFREQYIKQ